LQSRTASLIFVACLVGCATCTWTLGAAQWVDKTGTITIATHFSGTSQSCAGDTALTLNHDGAATIQASVATSGDETLTSSSSDTLTTSYKLTGAALSEPDSEWVSSAAFISPERSYAVQGTGPSEITLHVRGISASGRANDAGAYTGSITLTVAW